MVEEYDVIVRGTGLKECILSSLLSVDGIKLCKHISGNSSRATLSTKKESHPRHRSTTPHDRIFPIKQAHWIKERRGILEGFQRPKTSQLLTGKVKRCPKKKTGNSELESDGILGCADSQTVSTELFPYLARVSLEQTTTANGNFVLPMWTSSTYKSDRSSNDSRETHVQNKEAP